MARLSNKDLIGKISNGEDEILVYLTEKYFASSRRIIRSKGIKDELTPAVFSDAMSRAWIGVSRHRFTGHVEFETYFYNTLQESIAEFKRRLKYNSKDSTESSEERRLVASQCVDI